MNTDYMTIGQMCVKFDVTARALRFYESKGLLSPKRDGSKRLYAQADEARLRLILRAKRFGFSLEDAHQMLQTISKNSGADVPGMLLSMMKEQLQKLQAERDALGAVIGDLEQEIGRCQNCHCDLEKLSKAA